MKRYEFKVRGPVSLINNLRDELLDVQKIGEVDISQPRAVDDDILKRKPLYHIPIVEICIAISVNVVSSTIYEFIRKKIEDIREKKDVQVEEKDHKGKEL